MRKLVVMVALLLLPLPSFAQEVQEATKASLDLLKNQVAIGPLKLGFGPQDGGGFGATLTGGDSKALALFNNTVPVDPAAGTGFWGRYGSLDYDVDGGWSSQADAANNISLSAKARVTFVRVVAFAGEIPKRQESAIDQVICQEIDAALAAAIKAKDSAARDHAIHRGVVECDPPVIPIKEQFAVSLYPDLRYRYGRVKVAGTTYDANQLIAGAGARVFLPWRIGALLREWPYASVGYYTVRSSSSSNVPLPDDVDADNIAVDAALDINVPYPNRTLSTSPLQLLVKLQGSRATTGTDKEWQTLRHLQLSFDTGHGIAGQDIKPAITYRSGDNQGLSYDRQVIVGIVWDLLGAH
jgi:hypothetical protein